MENAAKAQQEQAQAQQAQQESMMKEQEARTNLANARAQADLGLYNERTSRVQENFAMAEERRSEAVANENKAMLDMVRTLKELESIDISHLKELMAMQQLVKSQEAENRLENATVGKQQTPEQENELEQVQQIAQMQQQQNNMDQQGAAPMG